MKKSLSFLFFFAVLLFPVTASAAGVLAHLSGPDTVQAGQTLTLTLTVNGSGFYGVSGALSYDSSQVTLSDTEQIIGGNWQVEFYENYFLVYDNALENPISGIAEVFCVTFQISDSLVPGTEVNIACTGITASDGSADTDCGTVRYSTVVAAEPAQQEPLATHTGETATQPTQPADAVSTPSTESTQTVPVQTFTTATVPAAPAEPEDSRERDSIPVGALILTATVCLGAGVCVGILLDQKIFCKK